MTQKEYLEFLLESWKETDDEIKALVKEKEKYREMIIKEMCGLREFECEAGSVKVSYPRTLDVPMMLSEQPKEITDRFWESITTEKFNKKKFTKAYPKITKKYILDMTPRVTIK